MKFHSILLALAVSSAASIAVDAGMAMGNYHSKTLNHNFPSISFVS